MVLWIKRTFWGSPTLFNTEATRPNIHKTFRKISKKITPIDNLIVSFSGHGETEGSIGYWVPVEAKPEEEWTFFSTDEIRQRLNAINSFHTFLLIDACFSGSLFIRYKNVRPGYETRRSRLGLASSHSKERALDGNPGENSPFAQELIKALKANDKPLGVQQLASEVSDRVIQKWTDDRPPFMSDWV